MDRRKFLIGTGSLAVGGAAVLGSGAFTNATFERDVTIELEGDRDGVIGLHPVESDGPDDNRRTSDGDYARIEDNQLVIELDELNERADFAFEDVFVIENNGTEDTDLDNVGSTAEGEAEWSYNDEDSPFHVLVGNELGEWQQDEGRFVWDDGSDPDLPAGEWRSIGIGFFGGDIGSWQEEEFPSTLRITLGG